MWKYIYIYIYINQTKIKREREQINHILNQDYNVYNTTRIRMPLVALIRIGFGFDNDWTSISLQIRFNLAIRLKV